MAIHFSAANPLTASAITLVAPKPAATAAAQSASPAQSTVSQSAAYASKLLLAKQLKLKLAAEHAAEQKSLQTPETSATLGTNISVKV